ncbi:MAG TPA: DUF4864 domain-containing protein [Chthoniobacterales bacterium]|nr:DUF4864 domain-containing protein [Chthoniobacterales bacterium]
MNWITKTSLTLCIFVLCLYASMITKRAQHPTVAPQPRELYAIVTQQLAAFRAADFTSAYRYAASGVQHKFSRGQFEQMVLREHSEMTRDARVEFGLIKLEGTAATMQVFLLRHDGSARAFLYSFVSEAGSWKINGVQATDGLERGAQLAGLHV